MSKLNSIEIARKSLEEVKPTPQNIPKLKQQLNNLNTIEAKNVAEHPEPGKNIKVKALANQVWNRAWGGYGGVAVNTNYDKIANQIKKQIYYNKLIQDVTKNNLNNEINKIAKRQPWYTGRGASNVYRSKQIIEKMFTKIK